jgi:hypothetical protein
MAEKRKLSKMAIAGLLLLVITLPIVALGLNNSVDVRSWAHDREDDIKNRFLSRYYNKESDHKPTATPTPRKKETENDKKPIHTPTPTPTKKPEKTPTPTPTPTPKEQLAYVISTPTAEPTSTPTPTVGDTPTPLPTSTSTPTPTPTTTQQIVYVNPTPTPAQASGAGNCNSGCTVNTDCSSSLVCIDGSCRNATCTTNTSCSCNPAHAAESPPKTPVSGGPTLLGTSVIGVSLLLFILGLAF